MRAFSQRQSKPESLSPVRRTPDHGKHANFSFQGTPVQTKLTISQPADEHEHEADRISEQVMRMREPQLQRACACGGECPRCAANQSDAKQGFMQTSRTAPHDSQAKEVPPVVNEVLRSPGQALDHDTSRFFQRRFGYDFDSVRVHADAKAADSAQALNAQAYTVGRDVVFGRGQYQPASASGRLLLAHELTHVAQQSGTVAPQLQRKVVDDPKHLPCGHDPKKSATIVGKHEKEAAVLAEGAATRLRANPISEKTRRLLWKKFRLDYNDPRIRCRQVPEIADRFAEIANNLRNEEVTYGCASSGEPEPDCSGHWGATRGGPWPYGAYKIDLCFNFWRDEGERALTLLHEWAHYSFWRSGVRDDPTGGFDTAGCYSAFALEATDHDPNPLEDTKCVPRESDPPELDKARVAESCPANVFPNVSLTVGYTSGFRGRRGDLALGAGLDLQFPLSNMHEFELSVGARFQRLAPEEPKQRAAYLFGVRAGPQWRQTPWRGGLQFGLYGEGGVVSLPEETGDRAFPYLGGGVTFGKTVNLDRKRALQFFADVGGRAGFDTKDDKQFGWFYAGLGASLELD